MRFTRRTSVGAAMLFCLGLTVSQNASAVSVLPAPGTFFDGIPVAIPYDDFFSYSGQLLAVWGFPDFSPVPPAGTGGLDVILYTGAGGADNVGVGTSGLFTFEDPQDAPGGSISTFSGTWGAGLEPNGPVLVDNVLNYLHAQFSPTTNIPVFTFDLNDTGDSNLDSDGIRVRDLRLIARVDIYDPGANAIVASWFMDTIANGAFDDPSGNPAAWVLAPGEITVTGASSTVYTVHNDGSGKADFIVFSPTMNLDPYSFANTGKNLEFRASIRLSNLDNGFEEFYLSGAITAQGNPTLPPVPEPASLWLMGSGLLSTLGLGVSSRKRA